jgi:hypothetical protein
MSRESDVYAVLNGDATLLATLTGGVFKSEDTGIDGITRETAPAAFAVSGYLKPCALVHERSFVPDGAMRDNIALTFTARQVVEVYLYCDAADGYTPIDTAKARVIALLMGHQFSDSFEVELVNVVTRLREPAGPLLNASVERLDWVVDSVWAVAGGGR